MEAPLPRCATTTRPFAISGATFGRRLGDILVGQAVESVAAYAFRVELLGKRIAVGNLGMAAMEGGIEAGNLQQAAAAAAEIARIGPRLLGWCSGASGAKRFKPIEHGVVDERSARCSPDRRARRDGRRRWAGFADLLAQELDDLVERCRHAAHFAPRPCPVDKRLAASRPWRTSRGCEPMPSICPFMTPLEPVAVANREQLKLDARAAGIDDEDGVGHGSGPDRLLCLVAVGEQHRDGAGRHARPHVVGARGQDDRAPARRARCPPHRHARGTSGSSPACCRPRGPARPGSAPGPQPAT